MLGAKQHITPNLEREAFTVSELIRILPLGRTTVRKMIEEKKLRVVRVGRKLLVPRAEIKRLLNDFESTRRDAA